MDPQTQIVIRLLPDGSVQVAGPLADKLLCYGLLEEARNAIRAWRPPAIEAPTPHQVRALVPGG